MKFILIMALLAPLSVLAKAYPFNCKATYNANKMFETKISLSEGQSLSIEKNNEFEFVLTSLKNNTYELQLVNIFEPSRSYATAKLTEAASFVELSIWRRDMLIETRCTLIH